MSGDPADFGYTRGCWLLVGEPVVSEHYKISAQLEQMYQNNGVFPDGNVDSRAGWCVQ